MDKDLDKEELLEETTVLTEDDNAEETTQEASKKKEKLTKEEKQAKKLEAKAAKVEAKKAKAQAKKDELEDAIYDLRDKIAEETNEKTKNKMRKQREELIKHRDAITKSKDGMTIPMAPKAKKILNSVIAIVLVVALLFAYVATGAVRHGLISYFGAPQSSFTGMTITDGDGNKHSVKVSTYNYYFASTYNNLQSTQSTYESYGLDLETYGMNVDFDEKLSKQTTTNDDGEVVTWAEYLHDQVLESIRSTYMYYYEAVKANDGKEPEITEDQQTELDDTLDEYNESAEGYGYTLSGYLTAAMGKGVTESVFRKEAKISYIAENYESDYEDELSQKEYTDDEYNDYKKENKADLVSVDVKMFECDSEDDAKAFKKALSADGSNFAELCSKYSSDDWDVEAYKDDVESTYKEITKGTIKNIGYAIGTAETSDDEDDEDAEETYPGLDWLYSSKRKAGDIKQYSTTVVYVIKPVYLSKTKTVNVRHILITPYWDSDDEDDEDASATDATAKQWKSAYKQAKKLLKEWKEGDATADTFGDLAKDNSADSNADDGGLYENVVPNQMVSTFNAWCFDSSRKAGDTAIVKTEYGYHIMYFESYGDLSIWQYTAQQSLASDDSQETLDALDESYTIKENWFGSRYFEKDTDIDS